MARAAPRLVAARGRGRRLARRHALRLRRELVGLVHPAAAHRLVDVHDLRVALGLRAHRGELGAEQLVLARTAPRGSSA